MNPNFHSTTSIDVQASFLFSRDGKGSNLNVAFCTFWPFGKGSSINNKAFLKGTL
jgi:hypothetical protein